MDTNINDTQNNGIGKKELKKQLADKIAAAIPELKATLGDKKFDHRIKKAVKLMIEGIHKKEAADTDKEIKAKAKSAGKASSKKTSPKAVKLSSKASKASPKKAKSAKKRSLD